MPAQVARMALIIHCCRQISEFAGANVDDVSIQSAILLGEYFKGHAKKIYFNLDLDRIQKMLLWAKKKNIKELTPRILQKNTLPTVKKLLKQGNF